MRPMIHLIAILSVAAMAGCSLSSQPLTERRDRHVSLINSLFDGQINDAVITQHTLFPHHFIAASAALNEHGERDLHALSTHLREHLKPPMLEKETSTDVTVYFDYDRAEIQKEALPNLDQAVLTLKEDPEIDIVITGHTDARGANEYNRKLGDRRAEAVRRYLVSKHIDKGRIQVRSRGELEADAAVTNDKGMEKDRRAHFVMLKVEEYPEYLGELSVRRGNVSEGLYNGRVNTVLQFLDDAGVDTQLIHVSDSLPGGEGMASERVLVTLAGDDASGGQSGSTSRGGNGVGEVGAGVRGVRSGAAQGMSEVPYE